jgi:uncharacterized membrane protein
MTSWATSGTAVSAAFFASLVEVVEAFTIVLAVGTVRGWRPALIGTGAGLALLALVVIVLGPALGYVPIQALQFVIGVLLLLFGMRWLRKAILRRAGLIPLHDENLAYQHETQQLGTDTHRLARGPDWLAGLTGVSQTRMGLRSQVVSHTRPACRSALGAEP